MPKISIGDAELYYEIHGKGEPIILIAGLGSRYNLWNWQIGDYSKYFQCVVFDNRGVGESSLGNIQEKDYTIDLLASDISKLMENLNIKKAHIVGTSMGGTIAQSFVLNYPDKVITLSLHATWSKTSSRLKLFFNTQVMLIDKLDPETFGMSMAPYIWSGDTLDHRFYVIEEFRKANRDNENLVSKRTYKFQVRACNNFDVFSKLSRITCPTLITVGSDDILIPPKYSEHIHGEIKNSKLYILNGCGHALIIEKAKEFNNLTIDFLKNKGKV